MLRFAGSTLHTYGRERGVAFSRSVSWDFVLGGFHLFFLFAFMVRFWGGILLFPVHPRCDVYLVLRYEYQVFDVVKTCSTGRVEVLGVVDIAERQIGSGRGYDRAIRRQRRSGQRSEGELLAFPLG